MANTEGAAERHIQEQLFWVVVHGSTEAIWTDCQQAGGPPPNNLSETAYEALGILHAQSHAVLERLGAHSQMLSSCTVELNYMPIPLALVPPDAVE